MELDQMRAFLAVVRCGSFSQAARQLFRTQPAISLRIRGLEEELGHQLLERRQRGVLVTPAGEVFRRRAEQVLSQVESLGVELSDLSDRKIGRVSLGASDTVCLYLLPRVLQQFTREYPGIELTLHTQISRRVLDLIQTNQIDIGIVTLPVKLDGIQSRPLYEDQFVVVVPFRHPLAKKRTISARDLKGLPIIHLKPETVTRRWIGDLLERHGLNSQVRIEVSTIEVIKRLVEAGLGISILPEMALTEELKSRRLSPVTLKDVPLRRPIGLAYRKDKYFSRALTAFVDHLVAHTNSLDGGFHIADRGAKKKVGITA